VATGGSSQGAEHESAVRGQQPRRRGRDARGSRHARALARRRSGCCVLYDVTGEG
jgi:hypothetical protein